MARDTIVDQFSYRGQAGAIWEGFDAFLDTEGYLNLGYSTPWQSHLIGSPQRRLAIHVATELESRGITRGDRLLDVGCGRGGPTRLFQDRLDVRCLGIDIVPYNLSLATTAAWDDTRPPAFALADGTALPIKVSRLDGITAIDSIAYVSEIDLVFSELFRVLSTDGTAVITDLLVSDEAGDDLALNRFAETWGFAELRDRTTYRDRLMEAGFTLTGTENLTSNSVGRFRKWARRYRRLRQGIANPLLSAIAKRYDLDLEAIDRQVETAYRVLPQLRHELFVIKPQS